MNQIFAATSMRKLALHGLIGLGLVVCATVQATPAGGRVAAATATGGAKVHAQLNDVDAKITAARAQQAKLQSQVTQMEQQNAARKQQLQQRDAEIAALQAKLAAAGAPAASASAGR